MPKRGLQLEDVLSALANAHRCDPDGPGKWKLFGPSLDDDELQVIVVFDPGLRVVTIYGC